MKTILAISLFFLSFNLFSQVELSTDGRVCMSKSDYKAIRLNKFLCDTLRVKYDSLIADQDNDLKIKDSIIVNLERKSELKDSIIVQKDLTIKLITEVKNKNKFWSKTEFWIGCLGGVLGTIILMK
jgi:hypothetical protein